MSNINLPNFLTLVRILAVPFCTYALFKDHGTNTTWQFIAFCGFFAVGMTDFADGRIARSRKQITPFGEFMDPIADKIAVGTALISLSILDRLWWWVTILILVREIGITIMRLTIIRTVVVPASRGGKAKTLFQGFGLLFYILPLPTWLVLPRDIFMTIAVVLTVFTGIDYVLTIRKIQRNGLRNG